MTTETLGGQLSGGRAASDATRGVVDLRAIQVEYEPVVDLATGLMHRLEAVPSPATMDSTATGPDVDGERRALIDLTVLELTASDLRRWRSEGLAVRVGVPVAVRTLALPGAVRAICATVARALVDPARVTLVLDAEEEVDVRALVRVVHALRSFGFVVAVGPFAPARVLGELLDRRVADELHVPRLGVAVPGVAYDELVRILSPSATERAATVGGIGTAHDVHEALGQRFRFGRGAWFGSPLSADEVEDELQRRLLHRVRAHSG